MKSEFHVVEGEKVIFGLRLHLKMTKNGSQMK